MHCRGMSGYAPALLLVLVAAAPARADGPATWPQWRGPTRDGLVPGETWPDTIQGDALRPLWRLELGPSYSGPVVSGERVFVTETRGGKDEAARALDRKTGKTLWEARWPGAMSVPFFARRNGDWIRATPALDGDRLYVAGMRDVLVCLDAATGAESWRVDFAERFKSGLPAFGFASSPLVDGDAVYAQAGGAFVKLDKRTGATKWRTLATSAGMMDSAFSSPVRATLADVPQLLVQTRAALAGVEPESGKVLWSRDIPAFRGMNILTPIVYGGDVFTSAHSGRSLLLRVRKDGDALGVAEAWNNKLQAYMSTPVVVGGHAYLVQRGRNDKRQPLSCIDLKTGAVRWTSDRDFGEYASLVAQGSRILALDNRGVLSLIRANPERFELTDSRKVSDAETWAHLAVCGDELFVRELNAIAAYRWKKE